MLIAIQYLTYVTFVTLKGFLSIASKTIFLGNQIKQYFKEVGIHAHTGNLQTYVGKGRLRKIGVETVGIEGSNDNFIFTGC